MTVRHPLARLCIPLLTMFGCTHSPSPTPLHEVSATLELVAQTPLNTNALCASIEPTHAKNECVLLGVDKLRKDDVELARSLCSSLKHAAKGECWFRLAERHDRADFCALSTPFESDCTLHLLSRWLFRHPRTKWTDMVEKARIYGVDPDSIEGETVLYRHVVSLEQPMRLDVCESLPKTTTCMKAAQSIYRDRLRFSENQGTFPCSMEDTHPLSHANQPPLYLIYTEFHDANCSD